MILHYIELAGAQHPMCFSLDTSVAIETEFGSLEAMGELVTSQDLRTKIQAINSVLEILLASGRTYAVANGLDVPPPLTCRPVALIGVHDSGVVDCIFACILGDSERTVEASIKNAPATQPDPAIALGELRGSYTTAPAPV